MNEFYCSVNGKKVEVKFLNENFVSVNDKRDSISITKVDKTGYCVNYGNKAFFCKILRMNNDLFEIFLNNSSYLVDCRTKTEFDAEEIALSRNSEKEGNVKIFAPMSGLVLKIMKKNGEMIKKGEPIIILEAMKMENEILAPNDGKIVLSGIKEGDTIEKNTKLFEIN
jgi:biotin carboxyl carrier protein